MLNALELLPQYDLKYKVAIYIALFGGLRKAEILGLNWSDFDGANIKIRRTRMIKRGEGVYESTPKTSGSSRLVSLPQQICTTMNIYTHIFKKDEGIADELSKQFLH